MSQSEPMEIENTEPVVAPVIEPEPVVETPVVAPVIAPVVAPVVAPVAPKRKRQPISQRQKDALAKARLSKRKKSRGKPVIITRQPETQLVVSRGAGFVKTCTKYTLLGMLALSTWYVRERLWNDDIQKQVSSAFNSKKKQNIPDRHEKKTESVRSNNSGFLPETTNGTNSRFMSTKSPFDD